MHNISLEENDDKVKIIELEIENSEKEIYICIFMLIFGIVGFFCLIDCFYLKNKNLNKREKLLFFNLFIIDFLIVIIVPSMQIYWKKNFVWNLGNIVCKFYFFASYYLKYLSSFITAIISYNRYQAFINPLSFPNENLRNKRLLIICYIFCFIISLPQVFLYSLERNKVYDYDQCVGFGFVTESFIKFYNFFELTFVCLIPAGFIFYFNIHIAINFLRVKNSDLFKETNTCEKSKNVIECHATKKTALMKKAKNCALKMVIIVPFKFLICWTPCAVYIICSGIDSDLVKWSGFSIQLSCMLTILNSVLNPWIIFFCSLKNHWVKTFFCINFVTKIRNKLKDNKNRNLIKTNIIQLNLDDKIGNIEVKIENSNIDNSKNENFNIQNFRDNNDKLKNKTKKNIFNCCKSNENENSFICEMKNTDNLSIVSNLEKRCFNCDCELDSYKRNTSTEKSFKDNSTSYSSQISSKNNYSVSKGFFLFCSNKRKKKKITRKNCKKYRNSDLESSKNSFKNSKEQEFVESKDEKNSPFSSLSPEFINHSKNKSMFLTMDDTKIKVEFNLCTDCKKIFLAKK